MPIEYYLQLVVDGFKTYWVLYVFIGGGVIKFIVSRLKNDTGTKYSGGSDWNKN